MTRPAFHLPNGITKPLIFFILLIFFIFVANALYGTYPDEFDNILGGKLILQGHLPYRDFFSHHGILAYYLSAVLVAVGGISFVRFRLLEAVFFLLYFSLVYFVFQKRVRGFAANYFLGFLLALALSMTYFWGHMFLADPLSGYLLLPAYGLFLLKTYLQEKLETVDLWLISLFCAGAVLNSTTYLYAAGVLALFTIISSQKIIKAAVIFAVPYLFFGLYLLITGSLSDFLFQAVDYNRKYYIYNYPRPEGSTAFNPVRYAVVLFNDFLNNFQGAASGIFTGVNFRFPLTHVLALGNIVFFTLLAIRKKFLLLAFCFLLLVYINARGNPAQISVKDYQTSVYFIFSLFNIMAFFSFLPGYLKSADQPFLKHLSAFLGIILTIYVFFGGFFILEEFWRPLYNRYMGIFPLIYDRPAAAPILNRVLTKDDYCWVGPFEFEEMFYLNCRLPSKYHWILPQFANIEKIKEEILADYERTKPPIIVFRRDYSAFGQSSAFNEFFVRFLDENYTRLKGYKFKDPKQKDFNFDDDFNFRKEVAPVYFQKLLELGYLTPSSQ
jgi:hypothetical protein